MRKLAVIISIAAAVTLAACEKVTSLKLPDPSPEQDLGFAALYDGQRPEVLGDVLRRQALFSGRYALEAAGGLEARLYFMFGADLLQAARAACGELSDASDRVVCEDTVTSCEAAPEGCWTAVSSDEGCGERLELEDVPLLAYIAEAGQLEAASNGVAPGVALCGPSLDAGCPNRRSGYLVTEAGRFACVAEARQLGCDVTLDAAECGLPEIRFTLDAEGEPKDVQAGSCARSAPAPSSDVLDAPKDFALDCDARVLDFRPQAALLATPGCPRRGPATFETDAPTTGHIGDGLAAALAGGSTRLYLSGEGFDDCANYGCAVRGEACNSACESGCSTVLLLEGCTRDSWAACVDTTQKAACLARCRSYCDRPRDAACYGETFGLSLTASAPEAPEQDVLRAELDTDGNAAAAGRPSLVALGGPWLAALTRDNIDVFEAESADRLARRGRFPTGLAGAGLLAYAQDRLVWFGADSGETRVRTGALTRGATPSLDAEPGISVPELPGADAGALGGPRDDWLFLARTSPRLDGAPRDEVHLVALSAGLVLPKVNVPGEVTALAALPQGAILVGFRRGDGRPGIGVLEPGADRVQEGYYLDLLPGLQVKAFALDPATCGQDLPSACRVYVGFETEQATQPALLGALTYDPANPEQTSMVAALRRTGAQTVSSLFVDPQARTLWAVAGTRNVLSPMQLVP